MIIAVPLTEQDEFSAHFGAAEKAGLFQVDPATRVILAAESIRPLEAEPCQWADWLGARGVQVFIASGMGSGAQRRMAAAGIAVLVGVAPAEPRALVQRWLEGDIVAGANPCEDRHSHHGHHHAHSHHGPDTHAHRADGCGCSH